jgi:hypothetical protein
MSNIIAIINEYKKNRNKFIVFFCDWSDDGI